MTLQFGRIEINTQQDYMGFQKTPTQLSLCAQSKTLIQKLVTYPNALPREKKEALPSLAFKIKEILIKHALHKQDISIFHSNGPNPEHITQMNLLSKTNHYSRTNQMTILPDQIMNR